MCVSHAFQFRDEIPFVEASAKNKIMLENCYWKHFDCGFWIGEHAKKLWRCLGIELVRGGVCA